MTKRCQDRSYRGGQECLLLQARHLVRSSLAISLSIQTCPISALEVCLEEVAKMMLTGMVDARIVEEYEPGYPPSRFQNAV